MLIRKLFPRLQQAGRILRPCYTRHKTLPMKDAAYKNYSSNRNVPMWRRRHFLENFFDRSGPFSMVPRMMDRQFQEMEKVMDEMWRGRWIREPFYTKTTGREVDVKYNDKIFEVQVDVSQYAPEDLNVKITDNKLTISAKHEAKPEEHGVITREFVRQMVIPEDVDAESFESLLTGDGHLIIKANVKEAEPSQERIINIEKESPKESK